MAESIAVEVYRDLDAVPAALAGRLSLASGIPFFSSIEWFRCLARHGTDAGTPRIYVAGDGAGTVCALYCLEQRRRLRGLSNYYTIEYDAGRAGPRADAAVAAIFGRIADERPRWTTLTLRNLPSGAVELFSAAAARSGFVSRPWPDHDNWYLHVAGQSFDYYYAARPSRLRNTIERKSRKAGREHGLRIAIYPADDLSLDEATGHFQSVYEASWKTPEPFPDFMPALIRLCGHAGVGRVGIAWIDDEPAAAQLWIRDGDRSFIYKLAYDDELADLSVGSILSKAMFRHAIDVDGVSEIDYGTGSEAYKSDWMSGNRTLSGLLCCNPRTLAGGLRNLREAIGARFRARR